MVDIPAPMDPLDFTEALKDSPRFRWSLSQHESYLTLLENKLQEILKQCHHMVEHGKAYIGSLHSMLEALADMNGTCFKADSGVFNAVESLSTAFEEVAKSQKVLVEQAYWSIVKNLNDFIKRELNKVHETRTHFVRVGQSLDDALTKNAQINKHKEQEGFEARNELTAVGTCFAHTTLDYVFQINMVQSRKKHEILDAVVSFLRAYQTFFHQGAEVFNGDFGRAQESVNETVALLKQNSKQVERKMQDRHMLVPREIFQHPTGMPLDPDVVMEGYLFKRASNAFKTWNRRWFVIRDNKLLYCHRDFDSTSNHGQVTDDGFTIMEVDLRLCLVRPAPNNVERKHCFELVTPTKNHLLQADSESLCNAWIKALQRSIESALHDSTLRERELDDRYTNSEPIVPQRSGDGEDKGSQSSIGAGESPGAGGGVLTTVGGVVVSGAPPLNQNQNHVGLSRNSSAASNSTTTTTPPKKRRILDEILSVRGNELCADCGARDPRWASINLGITLCIDCGASHRSLGVQVSKVRSLTLDAWEPEQLKLMLLLGNRKVNDIYLANLAQSSMAVPPPAKANSSRAARDAWIKAKYVDRQFAFPISSILRARKKRGNDSSSSVLVRDQEQVTPLNGGGPFPIYSSAAGDGDGLKAAKRNLRVARAKSVVQEGNASMTPTCGEPNIQQLPVKLAAGRHSCSSPELLRSGDGESTAVAAAADGTSGISSAFGSDSALNRLSDTGAIADSPAHIEECKRLVAACRSADLRAMCESLARSADTNYADTGDPDGTTALHAAILSGSVEACEFLLLNGAKINIQDSHGRTPLHLACQLGNVAQVCILLKRGASQELSTVSGETALDISMDLTNADIVTLLRLAKLNEEIKETEFGNGGDDTFVEVVRDISLMASNRPEMLTRSQQQQHHPSDSV